MKLSCSAKVLVIQIGEAETRVASLSLGAKPSQPQAIAVLPTPARAVSDGVIQKPEALRDAINTLRGQSEFSKARKAVFVLSSTQVISQVVTVPVVKSPRRLAQILETNADLYFPVDPGDYKFTWQVMDRKEEAGVTQTQVQLWATPKALLEPYYRLARDCGLRVAAIDYCGHSFARSVHASFAVPNRTEDGAEAATLYVHLEREHILLSFVAGERVLLQRLLRRGTPDADLNDIFMETECFHTEFPANGLDSCVVSGVEDEAFVAALAELVGAPLRQLTPETDPIWCVCLGAAMTELDFGDPTLDTLHGGKTGRGILQPVLLALAAVLFVGTLALHLTRSNVWERERHTLWEEYWLLQEQAAAVEGAAEDYQAYAAEYSAYARDWDDLFRHVRTYNDNACLILEELESILPKDSVVTHLALDEQSLTVRTIFEEKEDAAYFLVALRDMQYATPHGISDLERLTDEAEGKSVRISQSLVHYAMNDGRTAATQTDGLYTDYALDALLPKATLEQRQAAIRRLLVQDAQARQDFSLLAREAGLPEEVDRLVENQSATEAAEALIRTHYSLRRKLAEQLALEMGKQTDKATQAATSQTQSGQRPMQSAQRQPQSKSQKTSVAGYSLTVTLGYKEALIQVEQARKGLDKAAMLADPVEVTA